MINFRQFIIEEEQQEGKKLKHLTHIEDMPIHHGHEGVAAADAMLRDTHKALTGKGMGKSTISTKYDGAPSIVYGHHPETGKFFVASKSAFNKDPKINYTPEDVERNHGHAPGLVEKLKAALEHLPKVAPKKGVFQGDVMHTPNDVEDHDGKYHFTPNTIKYSVGKDSTEGKKIKNSKFGIVTHTQYDGKDMGSMSAAPISQENKDKFKQHPDVHQIDPATNTEGAHYTPEMQKEFANHMENARRTYANMDHSTPEITKGHEINLEAHVNDMVRKGGTPSVEGFISHLKNKKMKDVEKLKSPAGKEKKAREHDDNIGHVEDNKEHFKNLLDLHSHLQKAKNVLVRGLNSSGSPYEHSVDGKKTDPEGFVINRGDHMSKLVNRDEFSRMNLLGAGKMSKRNEPAKEEDDKPIVYAHGRMNPPHAGHEAVINKVHELANQQGADHKVVLTHTQDPEKNPLSPQDKLAHAKKLFPKTNFGLSDDEHPTLIEQLAKLNKAGHKKLTMVAGDDRVEGYKKLLNDRNGKDFDFKKIDVVSAGGRDPDSEGVEGLSASKMRDHAINGRAKEFAAGLPKGTSPEHAKQLMQDTAKGMDIPITPSTHPVTLKRHALRNDPIGHAAQKELNRRAAEKVMSKKKK